MRQIFYDDHDEVRIESRDHKAQNTAIATSLRPRHHHQPTPIHSLALSNHLSPYPINPINPINPIPSHPIPPPLNQAPTSQHPSILITKPTPPLPPPKVNNNDNAQQRSTHLLPPSSSASQTVPHTPYPIPHHLASCSEKRTSQPASLIDR